MASLVRRSLVRLAGLVLLLAAGLLSALVLASPGAAVAWLTTTTTTSTSAPATTVPTSTVSTLTASAAASALAISGHGYGHGYGLSQWGAYGCAVHGWTYDRILAHYYTGTILGPAPTRTLRVLLAERRQITLSSAVPWTVTDSVGTTTPLAAGDVVLTPDAVQTNWPDLVPPLTFSAPQPLSLAGRAYRGRFQIVVAGTKLQAIDVVSLESYIRGVVPAEMPSDWPAAALQAQAVAARSYALANRQVSASFDLYADTRSQAYGGVATESPAATAAIAATKGQVLLYGGRVADTLYSSSSGGRSAGAVDGAGKAIPYLASVPDPYDSASPYHDWGPVLVPTARIARLLKVKGPLADVQLALGADGRVSTVTAIGASGTQSTVYGSEFRVDFDLRSTWFSSALLGLAPVRGAAVAPGTLAGTVRGADGVTLEARVAGSTAWLPAQETIAPGPDGTFSLVVHPLRTTWYRLAWGSARVGNARVTVAPTVTTAAP